MPYAEVNLLAVLAATIANMVIGMIWYSPPVWGKIWMRETGMIPEKADASMAKAFTIGIIGTFIFCYFFGLLLLMVRPGSLQPALLFAGILWLGIIIPAELNGVAWERRSWTLLLINAGWSIISFIASTAILFSWGT